MVFVFGIALKFQKILHENIFINNQIFFHIAFSPYKTWIEHLRAWSGWGQSKKHIIVLALWFLF